MAEEGFNLIREVNRQKNLSRLRDAEAVMQVKIGQSGDWAWRYFPGVRHLHKTNGT